MAKSYAIEEYSLYREFGEGEQTFMPPLPQPIVNFSHDIVGKLHKEVQRVLDEANEIRDCHDPGDEDRS